MRHAVEISEVVDLLARKWTVEVIDNLGHGAQRYNELLKGLDDHVTPKVFTRVLRRLEKEGIVVRDLVNGSPPGVAYGLTDFGHFLVAALDDLAGIWMTERVAAANDVSALAEHPAPTPSRQLPAPRRLCDLAARGSELNRSTADGDLFRGSSRRAALGQEQATRDHQVPYVTSS